MGLGGPVSRMGGHLLRLTLVERLRPRGSGDCGSHQCMGLRQSAVLEDDDTALRAYGCREISLRMTSPGTPLGSNHLPETLSARNFVENAPATLPANGEKNIKLRIGETRRSVQI